MHILNVIFYALLEMSIIASVVGFVIFIIKKVIKFRISPKWLNILWVIFLVVLINPIRIQSEFSLWNVLNYDNIIGTKNVTLREEALDKHTNSKSEALIKKSLLMQETTEFKGNFVSENLTKVTILNNILVSAFFMTIIIKMIVSVLTNIKINRISNNHFCNERLNHILDKARKILNIKSKVKLINQTLITTPSIYGISESKILLTEDILKLSDEEIELILLHELSHKKNGDIYLNKILQLAKDIYFFNPLVIFFINQIKKDIELANDEKVLEKIEEDKINVYCKTLLKVSLNSNNEVCLGLGMASSTNDLEERIRMIKEKNKFMKNKILIFSMVAILLFGITVCFATNRAIELPEEVSNIENTAVENVQKVTFPLDGEIKITANYGTRMHPVFKTTISHDGIDLKAETGEAVLAVTTGVVENTGYDVNYGNFVEINHGDYYSFYAHLSSVATEVGEMVEIGQKIGEAGSTGMATGPHLHLEIRDLEKNTVNPNEYIDLGL